MTEFSVKDSVRTTVEWNARMHEAESIHGKVLKVTDIGPLHPNRRVFVEFSWALGWGLNQAWFDPNDLELDD